VNAFDGRAAGLVAGVALDAVFGDPARWHPVAGYGRTAQWAQRALYADTVTAGAAYALVMVVPVTAAGVWLERHPYRTSLTALATWTVIGGRSLRRAGSAIERRLEQGGVDEARELIPTLCGRDPASLDEAGMARASVESIAENTSDAVIAPLFWGAIAGIPGLLTYRAINTLDAMVGHRSQRYRHFGTASARADDIANLIPARISAALTVLAAPAVSGSAREGIAAWRSDASAHPSPNAGRCEAAMAGVLGVALGGRTVYAGRAEDRPLLGDGREPQPHDIGRAVTLSKAAQICFAFLLILKGFWHKGHRL
jgi:adenosylcobinamide-phosphate synthase